MLNPILTYNNIQKEVADFISKNKFFSIFILVDENTKKLCLPLLKDCSYTLIEIESGERNKTLESCQKIWLKLLESKADRSSLLINLGGGVISDMGGFCAATFKRGIAFINIPTTLLAMVDATIGGKTGIDFHHQKNMLGLFTSAKAIFIDPIFLKTLDKRQLKSGKAEMLKHGLIANKKHFEAVLKIDLPNIELIQKSIEIKQEIVSADPYEKGLRKNLNFGHTLGHALETYYLENNKDILHGEAVIQGMIWAIKLSVKYAKLDSKTAEKTIQKLKAKYKEIELNPVDFLQLLPLAQNDKKNRNQNICFVLLNALEKPVYNQNLSTKDILEVLK